MKRLRQVVGLAIVAFAPVAAPVASAHADESLSRLQTKGVVLVANTQESPPWSYIGPDSQPAGYDVAVAREIFRRIGDMPSQLKGPERSATDRTGSPET